MSAERILRGVKVERKVVADIRRSSCRLPLVLVTVRGFIFEGLLNFTETTAETYLANLYDESDYESIMMSDRLIAVLTIYHAFVTDVETHFSVVASRGRCSPIWLSESSSFSVRLAPCLYFGLCRHVSCDDDRSGLWKKLRLKMGDGFLFVIMKE